MNVTPPGAKTITPTRNALSGARLATNLDISPWLGSAIGDKAASSGQGDRLDDHWAGLAANGAPG